MRAETVVDLESGAIRFKKQEPWINTYNPVLSYVLRCNSDVTCLLSGTQVKAVVAYVTDYVTKSKLNTHTFFETVRMVLDRNQSCMEDAYSDREQSARALVTKMVNALTSLQETGGPAVCAYLLGQPDHYTDKEFVTFYWRSYVYAAMRTGFVDDMSKFLPHATGERVVVGTTGGEVVLLSRVNDYLYRPDFFEHWSLYDFLRLTVVRKMSRRRVGVDVDEDGSNDSENEEIISDVEDGAEEEGSYGLGPYYYTEDHPLHGSHAIYMRRVHDHVVLDFVGGTLPRFDRGDRDEYCMTMLVLFRPMGWRLGTDLRTELQSWQATYAATQFYPHHLTVMKNMNVLYECLDARDDFSAQRRSDGESVDDIPGSLNSYVNVESILEHTDDDFLNKGGYAELELTVDGADVLGKRSKQNRMEMEHIALLMRSCQTEYEPDVLLAGPVLQSIDAVRTPGQWKEVVEQARKKEVERRAGESNMASGPVLPSIAADGWTVDRLAVLAVVTSEQLDRLYAHGLDTSRGPQDADVKTLHGVVAHFSLNIEQLRAFEKVAVHLINHKKPPLRLYLGGMGGTGKSRVLSSLMAFLIARGEEYRFAVLGPTGGSAALINGATYHSMLGFGHQSSHTDAVSITALAKVRGRFERVELVCIDEVSMISCCDLYRISSQLSKAFDQPCESFGQKSIVLAGDFAQLPPAGHGQSPLYSDGVGPWSSAQTNHQQKNAIGKAIWHMFTDVVILRQNMRQTGASMGDIAFRNALSNLRYKSCTSADIKLLRSRVVSQTAVGRALREPRFRNVSIITARNSHRDAINMNMCASFARDVGQTLHHFHSVDCWGKNESKSSVRRSQRADGAIVDPIRINNTIHPDLQRILWQTPPALSEHHPGVLSLCVGMPVLLKTNEATELCVTNGAEASVYSWVSFKLTTGEEVLDTLFVELLNPPRNVQLDGLPNNVVPLIRTKKKVCCLLPNDASITVSREQISILPNFAMTDFASQGRTRINNVCHPVECRTHQALYTVFSRSSSLEGTLILEGFDERKMCGGASGALRREFRELEILDDIGRLRALNQLPNTIRGNTRNELVSSYQHVFGARHVPDLVHSSLRWSSFSDEGSDPENVGHKLHQNKAQPATLNNTSLPTCKRKHQNEDWLSVADAAKRSKASHATYSQREVTARNVAGLIWDSQDWSCAYDVILSILFNIQLEEQHEWFSSLCPSNELMAIVREQLNMVGEQYSRLELARNQIRDVLFQLRPLLFPRRGRCMTSLADVLQFMFKSMQHLGTAFAACHTCGTRTSCSNDVVNGYVWSLFPFLWSDNSSEHITVSTTPAVIQLLSRGYPVHCMTCRALTKVVTELHSPPPLIILEIAHMRATHVHISIDLLIQLPILASVHSWRLAGLVYAGSEHFTCRIITRTGEIYYHDGASTGRDCLAEGNTSTNSVFLEHAMSREVTHLFYVYVEPHRT